MNSIFFVVKLTLAIGLSLTGLNASLLEECNLYVLQAGKIIQFSSLMFSCMHIATPAKSVLVINSAAHIKFIAASLLPLSELLCAPTNITGIGIFSRMNDMAAEATA